MHVQRKHNRAVTHARANFLLWYVAAMVTATVALLVLHLAHHGHL